ncbi:Tar ligand binding domain-containing protein [Escherichia coli]
MSFGHFETICNELKYQVRAEQSATCGITRTRAVMFQASTALNKAGTLTALSYAADDVENVDDDGARRLTQSTTLFKSFMAMTAGNEHIRALQKETEKN